MPEQLRKKPANLENLLEPKNPENRENPENPGL
jgi:hypothetical protein